MDKTLWTVYLAGEIHSDWRQNIMSLARQGDLPVTFLYPEQEHATSDTIGEVLLGKEISDFWYDHKSAKINTIRNQSFLNRSDIVVVRFGEKYRQWNAAFDAGQAVALGKHLLTMHDPSLNHALKEIDARAMAVTETAEQSVGVLRHISR